MIENKRQRIEENEQKTVDDRKRRTRTESRDQMMIEKKGRGQKAETI